jgi:hypothetical protein
MNLLVRCACLPACYASPDRALQGGGSGAPPRLARLSHLDLSCCSGIGDAALVPLASFPVLATLVLDYCWQLTDPGEVADAGWQCGMEQRTHHTSSWPPTGQ